MCLPITWLVLVICTAVLVPGCGAPPRDGADNVLRININAEVADLDPQIVQGVPEAQVTGALFEGLTDLDPATLAPIPGAAESWEVSNDKLTYTFHLRRDGLWSNGDPVTAEDFRYSLQRILSPGLAAPAAYVLHCIRNAKAFNEGNLADFNEVGVRAADGYTLEIMLEHPVPYFLAMQNMPAWYPVHRSAVEVHGAMDERGTPWTRAGNLVGNGPFRLVEWRPGEYIRAARNEHYWDREHVRLDGIQFYPIDDLLTEERLFRTGALQMTGEVPPNKIPVYRREHPELLHIDPYLGVYYFKFNTTRAPFNDRRVRQAFSWATDRKQLAESILKGGEAPAFHLVPPGISGYQSDAALGFDPEKARALLAEAGYPNGAGMRSVEVLYNTSQQHKVIAEAVQRMWKTCLNVDVRLVNQDWKVYLSSTGSLDYDIAREGWIGDVADPMMFLEVWQTGGGNNETGYGNPAFDTLIQAAKADAEPARRLAVLKQAEDTVLEDLPMLPVYFYTRRYLQAPEVKGYVPNVLGYLRFQDFYLDRGDPAR